MAQTVRKDPMKQIGMIVRLISFGVLIACVIKELRLPSAERTWHGTLADFVPYDLRFPTSARFRTTFWNLGDRRILVPTALGVGWSVNLAGLAGLAGLGSTAE